MGILSWYIIATTNKTTIPPAIPINAIAGDKQIALSWRASTKADFASYQVHRGIASGNLSLIKTVTEPSYIDTTVTNGITYFYVVTVLNGKKNESEKTSETSATPKAVKALLPPLPLPAPKACMIGISKVGICVLG